MDASARIPDEIAWNLVDPKAFGSGAARIHDAYKWLRANNPLGLANLEGHYDPFWVVTKHTDILEVSRQNALFHSGDRQTTLTSQLGDKQVRKMTGGSPHLVRSLVQMDAPDHPKYRALTQSWFMPGNIKHLEERIRTIARGAVDKMMAKCGQCDFARDIAMLYPLHVIMEILGVPAEDEPRMLMLTQELFGAADSELGRDVDLTDPEKMTESIQAVLMDFYQYFAKITASRRAEPRDDLASVIANSTIDGAPISEFEALSYYVIVATAGHDTTSSSTAGAMWALAADPAQFAQVKSNPSLIPGLVDEAVRWTTPVKHFMRSATADTELRGRKIAKGDWLMLCYASGNRDEEIFEDPYVFRADRNPNRHLSFGYGAHLCLGQHLAKMEMRILFEELLPHLKSIELAGEPANSESVFVSGPKRVPIRFATA
ncbi:MAG TPA: cytochrome P450 [Rhizomicrobium sp.]|nr:cytochrome P450 [Rhizomicrobium sp.]